LNLQAIRIQKIYTMITMLFNIFLNDSLSIVNESVLYNNVDDDNTLSYSDSDLNDAV